jgi:small GTP-binding protein
MGFCSSEENDIKIMLIGLSGSGKTSIIKAVSG